MLVFIPKMIQINDVKIDDGIFIDFVLCSPSFTENPCELSTTNAILERLLSLNPNQLSQKKKRKITHPHHGEKLFIDSFLFPL